MLHTSLRLQKAENIEKVCFNVGLLIYLINKMHYLPLNMVNIGPYAYLFSIQNILGLKNGSFRIELHINVKEELQELLHI